MNWYRRVTDDLSALPDCIDWYNEELQKARVETSLKGNIEKNARDLPGIVEFRFNQLQEIEAILEHLNIELRKLRSYSFKKFSENYNRALSSRDVEKYVDGDLEVVEMTKLVNEFALIRNKFQGLIKSIDTKQFMINNIVKLRVAGLEDAGLS